MDVTAVLLIVLGCVMLAQGFGFHVDKCITRLATFLIFGYFLVMSRLQGRKDL